ncbi:hypothetical protein HMPREF9956_1251 [Staphylococcus epidermidis 14.1.R1.SE]|nr:hypothetical protein HMPREF9956_1251 [Staphylococcus epidermidis 14.1.R1.SE]
MKNYSLEYFKAQINKKFSEPKTKPSTVKENLVWSLVFRFMKAILGSLECLFKVYIKPKEN